MPAAPLRRAPRVGFVNTHPIQYFAPLYRYINATERLEAVPIYLTDVSLRGAVDKQFGHAVKWDIDLLSGTNPVFLKGADTREVESGPTKMLLREIWSLVRLGRYDALVVHGHNIGANHIAWAAAKSIGIPVFTRGESHLGLTRSARKRWLRRMMMPPLYAMYDGVLAIGSANAEFYRAMGVPDRKITLFPYAVDNDRLFAAADEARTRRCDIRAQFGIEAHGPAVLYCSKFMRRKHPEDLIHAAARLARQGVALTLVMAGSGEMEAELRSIAAQYPMLRTVFPGFFNQSELPALFAACDIFVLPSRNEPWGLVINEAMCAGLPVVASREIGCVADLIRDGVNGYVFDAGNVDSLAAAILSIIADPARNYAMGEQSRAIISQWGYRQCLDGLVEALGKTGIAVG